MRFITRGDKYLLKTEFEVRTVSYRPSFSPFDLAQERRARAINRRGETKFRNGFKFLKQVESKTNQFEIVLSR